MHKRININEEQNTQKNKIQKKEIEPEQATIFGLPLSQLDITNQNIITFEILINIIISDNKSHNKIKAQILNLFYFHTNLLHIEYKALELLVRLNDPDINQALRMSMCNITSLLIVIIENNNFLFFTECINDKTKKYNKITILCKIAQTNLNLLYIFNDNKLSQEEIIIILRIALVHIDEEQIKCFIVNNINEIDSQQILEIAVDYNNINIALFMLKYAMITIRVLYLSTYHEELFKILYTKIDKNILNITENISIIDNLELIQINNYKKKIKF